MAPIHNNNRDGAGQNMIHKNTAPCKSARAPRNDGLMLMSEPDSPNTLNEGFPKQATQKEGRGFFTAPGRMASGALVRERSSTFSDHWSQPRLFYNSLTKVEQQFLIDAIRFETSQVGAPVQKNVLEQLNKISHDIAVRVGKALGMEAPAEDPTYYHDNKTRGISIFGEKLPTIATLKVGVLASTSADESLQQAKALKDAFAADKVTVVTVGETLAKGVDMTYSAAGATGFDGIIVADGAEKLFGSNSTSTLYPPKRPAQIVADGYNWGKPVGFLGSAQGVGMAAGAEAGEGVYTASEVDEIVKSFREGLAVFKFTGRFPTDD